MSEKGRTASEVLYSDKFFVRQWLVFIGCDCVGMAPRVVNQFGPLVKQRFSETNGILTDFVQHHLRKL